MRKPFSISFILVLATMLLLSAAEAPRQAMARAMSGGSGAPIGVDQVHVQRWQTQTESRLKRELRQASAEIDAFWRKRYAQLGGAYTSPRLRTFQAGVRSGCGQLASGVGPFYCSLDQTIYVDVPMIKQIAFFRDPFVMRTIFAHEWAHHIQFLSGYEAAIYPDERGEVFSLQLELHADCLAGVWAFSAVEAGVATEDDLLNAMALAYATGDPLGTSLLAPDAHGSSEMRLGAFTMGLELGRPKPCEREILKLL